MSPDDEDALTAAYADLARPTAPSEEPVAAVRRRMRRRSQRRRSLVAAAAAVVVTVVGVGIHESAGPRPGAGGAAGAGTAAGGATASQSGALPGAGTQACAVEYNRQTLAEHAWAADATVTRIGRGRGRDTVTVVLDVHRWYRGGSGTALKVRMPSPRSQIEDAPPTYGVGTRLLLSGSGSNEARLVSTCGFTRYYDTRTAAVWAKVFTR